MNKDPAPGATGPLDPSEGSSFIEDVFEDVEGQDGIESSRGDKVSDVFGGTVFEGEGRGSQGCQMIEASHEISLEIGAHTAIPSVDQVSQEKPREAADIQEVSGGRAKGWERLEDPFEFRPEVIGLGPTRRLPVRVPRTDFPGVR